MCLLYNEKATKNFWKTKSRKGKTWCWAYKIFRLIDGNLLPAFGILFQSENNPVKPGFIISNRRIRTPLKDIGDIKGKEDILGREFDEINRGIHAVVNSQAIPLMVNSSWTPDRLVVTRVKCYKKDFVAASNSSPNKRINGSHKWSGGRGEAVFMKVFLPKTEYDRVMKKEK